MTIKELGRQKVEGVTVISYEFSASGLPKDKAYKFWGRELGNSPEFGFDATILDNGVIVKSDPQNPATIGPLTIKVFGVPAEPKVFALVSTDGLSRAFGVVIPFPIESKDGACKLSVVMSAPLYALVTLRLEGLKPNESFQVTFQSGREGGRLKPKADDQGQWNSLVGPFVKGKKQGFSEVKVSADDCHVRVVFPWGVHFYQ